MAILQYQGCYISHTASTVGRIEAEGPLGACFDLIERDPYFGEESWEKAESEMVHRTLNVLLKKAAKKPEEIDLILGGDVCRQRAENPLPRPVRSLLDGRGVAADRQPLLLRRPDQARHRVCRLALLLVGAAVPLSARIRQPENPDGAVHGHGRRRLSHRHGGRPRRGGL